MPLGSGFRAGSRVTGEPVVIVSDKEADPRYVPIAALRGRDFTSMASVPMEIGPGERVASLWVC